ncbi:MAG: hypothetical protein ABSE49_28140 [Polyangiaceae bacterium]|jgi:hypothetical protein
MAQQRLCPSGFRSQGHDFDVPVRGARVYIRKCTLFSSLLVLALAMTPTASASADEPPVPSLVPPMPEPATRWYGWQALLADVPSSLMMTAFFNDDLLVSAVGASVFLLVPPAIHLAHGHPIKAIVSFAMRAVALGGPLTIGLYAAHKDCQSGGDLCGWAERSSWPRAPC